MDTIAKELDDLWKGIFNAFSYVLGVQYLLSVDEAFAIDFSFFLNLFQNLNCNLTL